MRRYRDYYIAKWLLVVILLTTTLALPACACPATPSTTTLASVTFPDTNLEAVIRETIDKPEGSIYTSEFESLAVLDARERGINDLTGLEYCLNLRELDLENNNISDISALVGLNILQELNLKNNNISDISALASLANLEGLYLNNNNISDISALVNNVGLAVGDGMNLQNNPLSAKSINAYIPQLEARGVFVHSGIYPDE